jgi:hypothetical protein
LQSRAGGVYIGNGGVIFLRFKGIHQLLGLTSMIRLALLIYGCNGSRHIRSKLQSEAEMKISPAEKL